MRRIVIVTVALTLVAMAGVFLFRSAPKGSMIPRAATQAELEAWEEIAFDLEFTVPAPILLGASGDSEALSRALARCGVGRERFRAAAQSVRRTVHLGVDPLDEEDLEVSFDGMTLPDDLRPVQIRTAVVNSDNDVLARAEIARRLLTRIHTNSIQTQTQDGPH